MKELRIKREIKKVQSMLRSGRYCLISSGDVIRCLIHQKTNEVYVPKFELRYEN